MNSHPTPSASNINIQRRGLGYLIFKTFKQRADIVKKEKSEREVQCSREVEEERQEEIDVAPQETEGRGKDIF